MEGTIFFCRAVVCTPIHLPTFLSTWSHILHLDCIHTCMLVLPPPKCCPWLLPWGAASGRRCPEGSCTINCNRYAWLNLGFHIALCVCLCVWVFVSVCDVLSGANRFDKENFRITQRPGRPQRRRPRQQPRRRQCAYCGVYSVCVPAVCSLCACSVHIACVRQCAQCVCAVSVSCVCCPAGGGDAAACRCCLLLSPPPAMLLLLLLLMLLGTAWCCLLLRVAQCLCLLFAGAQCVCHLCVVCVI